MENLTTLGYYTKEPAKLPKYLKNDAIQRESTPTGGKPIRQYLVVVVEAVGVVLPHIRF